MADARTISLRCPKCETPSMVDGSEQLFLFPQDAKRIVDLIEDKLGLRTCKVCGDLARVPLPLACVDVLDHHLTVAQMERSIAEAVATEGGYDPRTELTVCGDLQEFRAAVTGRTRELLN